MVKDLNKTINEMVSGLNNIKESVKTIKAELDINCEFNIDTKICIKIKIVTL